MVEKGRRPGKRDTRVEIIEAARELFAQEGYEQASLRGVASRAAVDPALVHHYFPGGKAELFGAATREVTEPRLILDRVATGHEWPVDGEAHDAPSAGATIVANFLRMWDEAVPDAPTHPFVTFAQAASSSPEAAAEVREFLADRIWSRLDDGGRPADELRRRRSLVASQLMGLGFVRYVLQLEPVATADVDDLAAWVGPTIDRYHVGELDDPPSATSSA
jgi:AcrR family transcriptional regulator